MSFGFSEFGSLGRLDLFGMFEFVYSIDVQSFAFVDVGMLKFLDMSMDQNHICFGCVVSWIA